MAVDIGHEGRRVECQIAAHQRRQDGDCDGAREERRKVDPVRHTCTPIRRTRLRRDRAKAFINRLNNHEERCRPMSREPTLE
eukprot:5144794-Prymnesium_polylepis.1